MFSKPSPTQLEQKKISYLMAQGNGGGAREVEAGGLQGLSSRRNGWSVLRDRWLTCGAKKIGDAKLCWEKSRKKYFLKQFDFGSLLLPS